MKKKLNYLVLAFMCCIVVQTYHHVNKVETMLEETYILLQKAPYFYGY